MGIEDNIKNIKPPRLTYCPYIKGHKDFGNTQCSEQITRMFFQRLCNTGAYEQCKICAKKHNELKNPIAWLQKEAVDKENKRNPKEKGSNDL